MIFVLGGYYAGSLIGNSFHLPLVTLLINFNANLNAPRRSSGTPTVTHVFSIFIISLTARDETQYYLKRRI